MIAMKQQHTFSIAGRKVGAGHPVFIIAEVGVNHNGSIEMAKELIDAAKAAGADAVKFQMCDPDQMVVENAPKAAYQEKTAHGESHYDMLKRLYFGVAAHTELKAYAKKKGIIFFSTPFSIPDARALISLKMPAMKVGSSDTNNFPQLRVMSRAKVPMLLSTGMSTLAEVAASVKVIQKEGNSDILVFHCTTAYPTGDKEVNLKAMLTMRDAFHLPVGYSDHTPGTDVSIAAVALGASAIEKHITLDKTLPGPDHFASLEPQEFKSLVESVRRVERILGTGEKVPTAGEKVIARVARKSIVAARDIPKGKKIEEDDLAFKRPGTGLSPSHSVDLVGKVARQNVKKDARLTLAVVGK